MQFTVEGKRVKAICLPGCSSDLRREENVYISTPTAYTDRYILYNFHHHHLPVQLPPPPASPHRGDEVHEKQGHAMCVMACTERLSSNTWSRIPYSQRNTTTTQYWDLTPIKIANLTTITHYHHPPKLNNLLLSGTALVLSG